MQREAVLSARLEVAGASAFATGRPCRAARVLPAVRADGRAHPIARAMDPVDVKLLGA